MKETLSRKLLTDMKMMSLIMLSKFLKCTWLVAQRLERIHNFYLQVLENPKTWFKDLGPLGENSLGKMVKPLFEEAGIPGHFTNHSLRRSKVTRMFQAGIEKNDIMKETGHRSDVGVMTYREFSRKEKITQQSILEHSLNVGINEKEENHLAIGDSSSKSSKIHVTITHGDKSLTIDI